MSLNTEAMNHMHESAPANDWRRRPVTRAAVCLLSWWVCGISQAVEFPSMPLQTGSVQPAPNIIFILDDSLSMTSVSGTTLDTGLSWSNTTPGLGSGAGAPYTKNPLSYNPVTVYKPWATHETSKATPDDRLGNATYTAVSDDLQFYTDNSPVNLSATAQTYYVPKPGSTAADLRDQRKYYRYQILPGGKYLVRSEWVNTAPAAAPTMTVANTWANITGGENYWGNTNNASNNGNSNCKGGNGNFIYQVPSDGSVTRVVISTTGATGTNDNPDLYVRSGANPCTNNYLQRANSSSTDETITIDYPPAGDLYIGVYNAASGSGDRTFSNLTLTVRYTTDHRISCSTAATNTYGWKNCTDVSAGSDLATTKVRAVEAEKQNYANWYQYHRTRMKTAKAGGSEAFATLDENFRVGLMGLYPSGDNQQVIGGATDNAAPTASAPGNLNDIIPVDTDGGLFTGTNRENWFDHLHGMAGKNTTPLRKALDGAGKYFTTARAYESVIDGKTTYLACRQNFAILTTDGYWNNFRSNNGTYDDPDSNYADDKISGDEEEGKLITRPNGASYKYEPESPYWYADLGDYEDDTTLADIAMHYWKTDLRTSDVSGYAGSAENRVATSELDPAFWQHMVTFGVGLGVRGKLTDAEVASAIAGEGYWPAPVHETTADENPENVDDLRHAALNARGSYINANDSVEFSRGITNALSRISERRGSASNVLANSTSIRADSFVYQATYTAGAWRGELLAYPVSSTGLSTVLWRASEKIPDWEDRNIFTIDSSGGTTFPSSDQSADLVTAATKLDLGGVTGPELAQFLKGDSSRELPPDDTSKPLGVLRKRWIKNSDDTWSHAPLGDIVDSSPFYVADIQTIFVGANDGMLHAFDASNAASSRGTERFAYIPRGVAMSELAETADPDYGTNTTNKPHRFFVDGPVVVSARSRTLGVNYLVGALGRGGRGVYGLDVTNPGAFAATNVLWDKTGSEAPDNMGNVISEPLISKLNGDDDFTGAVVANGPNSKTGTASLFILDLTTGEPIKEFDTATTDNGLSAPRAVDVNADGKVDYFFAGDLQGNLWRFDVSSPDSDEWVHDRVFIARDSKGNVQPISSAPGVARSPATGKIWVFFGTGRYMTDEDQASINTQTYYGVIVGDKGSEGSDLTRTDLQERDIYVVDTDTGRRAFEPTKTGVDTGMKGWFVDLDEPVETGERVISAPLIYDNILVFSSIVPPNESTVNSCDAGGTGYVNALDAFSGTSLAVPFFDVLDPTIKYGSEELPIGSLPIGAGMPTAPIIIGNQLVVGDSSGGTPTSMEVNAPGGSSKRRVSWRELLKN